MEHNDKPNPGVPVIISEAPSDYHVAPRVESSTPTTGASPFGLGHESSTPATGAPAFGLGQESSTPATGTLAFGMGQESSTPLTGTPAFGLGQESSTPATRTPAFAWTGPTSGMMGSAEKKKRGRPRKYGPDGVMGGKSGELLSATPISARPLSDSGDFSDLPPPPSGGFSGDMKGKAHVNASEAKRKHMNEAEGLGFGLSTGGNFIPQVLIVQPGEDVASKIQNIYDEGSRSICVISGSGYISNVTLREFDSSGDRMAYEGRFEIVSLSGSFVPTKVGLELEQCGGLSISLSSVDRRSFGGTVAGLLIAATPVQIMLGSFLPSGFELPKQKKMKGTHKPPPATAAATTRSSPMPPPLTVNVNHPISDEPIQSHHPPSTAAAATTTSSPTPPPFTVNANHPISDEPDQSHHDAAGTSSLPGSSSVSDLNFDDWGDITGMHLGPEPGKSTDNDNNIPPQGE